MDINFVFNSGKEGTTICHRNVAIGIIQDRADAILPCQLLLR